MSYKIVNPAIKGTFENSFSSNTPLTAAKKAWKSLSSNFEKNVPKFAFTMLNTKDGSLSHFVIKESISKDSINFDISEIQTDKRKESEFKDRLENFEKSTVHIGGKLDDSSSSSSSSDSEIVHQNFFYQPITYWWYDTTLYNCIPDCSYLYVPTFMHPCSPYIQYYIGYSL